MTRAKTETGINEATVADAYRRVLAGEKLDTINVREEVKDIIREFSKYSGLSACQISEKTGISTRICGALHKIDRVRRKRDEQPVGISYAVAQLLRGETADYLKWHNATPETIKRAKKCIKVLEAGGKVPELYKLGLSHTQALRLIELYNEKSKKLEMMC